MLGTYHGIDESGFGLNGPSASFTTSKSHSRPSPAETNNRICRIKCGALLGQLDDLSASFSVPHSHECCHKPDRLIDPFALISFR